MGNPFDQVNQAMKDRDDKFTKREMASMHMLAAILSNAQLPEGASTLQLVELAIKSTDVLFQELGRPRNGK